jgi:hypothetical protein
MVRKNLKIDICADLLQGLRQQGFGIDGISSPSKLAL